MDKDKYDDWSRNTFFDWFIIHFTENKGMAFGMEFGGNLGKYILSIFRIIAIVAISIYWVKLAKLRSKKALFIVYLLFLLELLAI